MPWDTGRFLTYLWLFKQPVTSLLIRFNVKIVRTKLKWDTIVPIWDKPPGCWPAAMCFLDVVRKFFNSHFALRLVSFVP